jgi:hypothetical protein
MLVVDFLHLSGVPLVDGLEKLHVTEPVARILLIVAKLFSF